MYRLAHPSSQQDGRAESDGELFVGRRAAARLRVDLTGRLITLGSLDRVNLEDLSTTGARVFGNVRSPSGACVLYWLEFDVMGRIQWARNSRVGIEFDEPIPEEWLLDTRRAAPDVPERLKLPGRRSHPV